MVNSLAPCSLSSFQDKALRSYATTVPSTHDTPEQVYKKLNKMLENPTKAICEQPAIDEKWPDDTIIKLKIDACVSRICLFRDYLDETSYLERELKNGRLSEGGNIEERVFHLLLDRFNLIKKIQSRLLRWERDHNEKLAVIKNNKPTVTCQQVHLALGLVQKIFIDFIKVYLSSKEVQEEDLSIKKDIAKFNQMFEISSSSRRFAPRKSVKVQPFESCNSVFASHHLSRIQED